MKLEITKRNLWVSNFFLQKCKPLSAALSITSELASNCGKSTQLLSEALLKGTLKSSKDWLFSRTKAYYDSDEMLLFASEQRHVHSMNDFSQFLEKISCYVYNGINNQKALNDHGLTGRFRKVEREWLGG